MPRGLSRATHEDFDAAPSGAVLSPNEGSGSGDEVTAILADEQTNTLWTGEGWGGWGSTGGSGDEMMSKVDRWVLPLP